ncbi:MAG: 16S rRNA (cytidine(1402)-2'-O)-methyltransferase, partial [Rickettsiales bacterium]|nr:16S rRNA (cytidine(1402)-2'-O)-methyltransferase [Rickettsiales bacterium]
MEKLGTLFVVSTPIGNIGDMTYRAVEVLKNADLIACEDTRVSGRLLKEYQIKGKLTSFFEHNEDYKSQLIISELSQGKNVALISDAGTPLISDPGFKLVRMVRDLGFNVEAVPGACSPICALTLSGFPTDKFMFLGFLPAKDGKKEKILREYLSVNSTLIFFDSPHRIKFSIELLVKLGIKNEICVCREMTKKYQEVIIGTPAKVLEKLEAKDAI